MIWLTRTYACERSESYCVPQEKVTKSEHKFSRRCRRRIVRCCLRIIYHRIQRLDRGRKMIYQFIHNDKQLNEILTVSAETREICFLWALIQESYLLRVSSLVFCLFIVYNCVRLLFCIFDILYRRSILWIQNLIRAAL